MFNLIIYKQFQSISENPQSITFIQPVDFLRQNRTEAPFILSVAYIYSRITFRV